jgi:hypothetical protein
MKQHIGSIYLILGLMSVSAITIGAGKPHVAQGEHSARVQALLPSPTSFQFVAGKQGKALPGRILVIGTRVGNLDAEIGAQVARSLASTRVCKAG